MQYFLAYDVGTSSVKSILVDAKGQISAASIASYPLLTPKEGWVEQVPDDYWKGITSTTKQLIEKTQIPLDQIKGIVFSTQAMGIIPVDKQGNVLHNNISWVDGRAEKYAQKLMSWVGGKAIFKAIMGIEITGKDVIPKLMWLKETCPDVFQASYKFLDVNGYLKYRCTGKMLAEWSGACAYAFDLKKKDWDRWLFKLTGIGTEKLPDLVRSTDCVGVLTAAAAEEMGLIAGIPVFGGCDDTQSAAMGTGANREGEAHIYLGTSAWLGITTAKIHGFKRGAVCLQSADPAKNLLVGITESAGANTEWLLNQFYKAEKANFTSEKLFDYLENEVKSTDAGANGLLLTPWFLGERCPVSSTTTRATLFNLNHTHTRAHIARAHFEGIAFNLRWTLENMQKDFGYEIKELKITGGGSENAAWMQIIADICQKKIICTSQSRNAGALGAAICAMVGSGVCKNFEEIENWIESKAVFLPNAANKPIYDKYFYHYIKLFKALKKNYIEVNSSL